MQPPPADLLTHLLLGVLAHRGEEGRERLTVPAPCPPGAERVPQEREVGVLMIEAPLPVLAVHDLGLGRVQPQPNLHHPVRDRHQQPVCLPVGHTVHDSVIRVPLKFDGRVLPDHPRVERVVGSPRGISPRGSHRTERDSLPSLRSSHPLHRYSRIQAQWAKSSGTFGSDLLTHLLPGNAWMLAQNKSQMSRPLRSTSITEASALLRAGPPACPHRYSTPHSFCCSTHSLSPPTTLSGSRSPYRHTPSHVPCSSRRPDSRHLHTGQSGGRGESHPPAPTEPCVTVSRHTALPIMSA